MRISHLLPDMRKPKQLVRWEGRIRYFRYLQHRGWMMKPREAATEVRVCKNCGYEMQAHYCPNCGQPYDTDRLNVRNMFSNVFSAFFSVDNGFLHTLIDLCWRPGYMVRDYLQGRRVNYFKPFQTLFTMAAIFLIFCQVIDPQGASNLTGGDFSMPNSSEVAEQMQRAAEDRDNADDAAFRMIAGFIVRASEKLESMSIRIPESVKVGGSMIYDFLSNNVATTFVLLLPFLTKAFRRAFRKTELGRQLNYAECFFILVYLGSQMLILDCLTVLFTGKVPEDLYLSGSLSIVSLFFWIMDAKQLFGLGWRQAIRRFIAMMLWFWSGILLLVILSAFVVGGIVGVYKWLF